MCSPSYPTIETLREGWAECRRGEQTAAPARAVVWVGPFANSTRVWASRKGYLDETQPYRGQDIDPRVYEPRSIPVKP